VLNSEKKQILKEMDLSQSETLIWQRAGKWLFSLDGFTMKRLLCTNHVFINQKRETKETELTELFLFSYWVD
jgi:hypothetical protein